VEPPELARLIDLSERARAQGWSLRAALCRYAQPQPQRVSDVLDLVRRIELALHNNAKLLEQAGPELWHALTTGDAAPAVDQSVVSLLEAVAELDRLGDTLAEWAVEGGSDRPDAAVEAVTTDVTQRLEALGVPHEERTRPPRQGR
jgi:hypothetical protein